MKTFKTIAQIEEMTTDKRYYRAFDYARSVALVGFLRELEKEHQENFCIMSVSPIITYNRSGARNDDEFEEECFTFGLWCKFKINDIEYYVEMNENPFFNAYMTKSWRLPNEPLYIISNKSRCEYIAGMNDIIYNNIEFDATQKTIDTLVENLKIAFQITKDRKVKMYTQDIPAYRIEEKQELYGMY